MKTKKFKVGDKLVEFGQVFTIFKIGKSKDTNGKSEDAIFFKPHYKISKSPGLICSIPIKNIHKTKIRKPISKEKLKKLTTKLKSKSEVEKFPTVGKVKELLKSNNPTDTVIALRSLWKEKEAKPDNFPKSMKDVFELAIENLTHEFALVNRLSLDKAKKKILSALQISSRS
jgi:RNA polymerase-interacting CarD/CdnL/TRCF family regulator